MHIILLKSNQSLSDAARTLLVLMLDERGFRYTVVVNIGTKCIWAAERVGRKKVFIPIDPDFYLHHDPPWTPMELITEAEYNSWWDMEYGASEEPTESVEYEDDCDDGSYKDDFCY